LIRERCTTKTLQTTARTHSYGLGCPWVGHGLAQIDAIARRSPASGSTSVRKLEFIDNRPLLGPTPQRWAFFSGLQAGCPYWGQETLSGSVSFAQIRIARHSCFWGEPKLGMAVLPESLFGNPVYTVAIRVTGRRRIAHPLLNILDPICGPILRSRRLGKFHLLQ
jgi:hypothetical protein